MDGVVREVNVKVLGKGLELLGANGSRFEITSCYLQMIQHQWLTQEEKLCKPVTEFGIICERRKLLLPIRECRQE